MEQLAKYFTPELYEIELRINKDTEQVQGRVKIQGVAKSSTVKLHAKNLKIHQLTVNQSPTTFTEDAETETISFASPAKDAEIIIEVRYSLQLSHGMTGLYLSTYEHEGKTERIVSTQFESHYARMMFPCVDEPAAKAKFSLKVIDTDPTDTILSNMPIKTERTLTYTSVNSELNPKTDPNAMNLNTEVTRKIVEFETTPRMSTYLLVLCLGHFQSVTTKNQHGVTITTYAPLNQAKESLVEPNQIAGEALDFYDQAFGVPYPLPKLDQVAVPDFDAGAMENWGLVTYRESCLLMDETATLSDKIQIATVITHELSHQWFGNLVTMAWWDDLWLNESFANMMEYYCLDAIRPEWKVWQEYFVSDCYYALTRDVSPDIQAVKQAVNHPSEIETLFDPAIVYAKGSHLMFMLMRLMGEQNFLKGLRDYFEKHQYQNTTGDDLWAALQPYAEFNVSDFMNQWITRPGFPIIEGEKQERFYLDGRKNQESWPLVRVSDDMTGHYIIGLTSEELQTKLAQFSELSQEQQLRLLIDQSLLLRTPRGDLLASLDLLMHFRKETSFAIWSIIMSILGELKIYCPIDTSAEANLKQYIKTLISDRLARLGVTEQPEDTDDDKKLRELILSLAIYADDEETKSRLTEQYNIYINKNPLDFTAVSPELLLPYLDAEFKTSKEARFSEYLRIYTETASPTIKTLLLDIITNAKQEAHLETLLKLLSDSQTIRPQDHRGFVRDLLANQRTREKTFTWLYANWDYLVKLVDGKSLDTYLKLMARFVRTEEARVDFEKFATRFEKDPALSRIIKIGLYEIENQLNLITKNQQILHQKLEKYVENN